MRKWLTIILGISLLLTLCNCVAEVRPGVYRPRGYYHEYPVYRYDYDYRYGHGSYYRFRTR